MVENVVSPDELARQAYAASVRLLEKRDHSVYELTRKLQQRQHSQEAVDSAVQQLLSLNYLNDARYAELYSEQRLSKGFGPLSIRAKLYERGVSAHLIESGLKQLAVDWSEQAERVVHKRFNRTEISSTDQKVVAKIASFLQRRGYAPGDAMQGLKKARLNTEI